jgi:fructokinase
MPYLQENMQLATVVRGSSEDFQILFGTGDANEVYEKYISPHCDTFIYTDGAKPIRLFTPTLCASYPAQKIETVSTIGAGDNFNAGFCYALYHSKKTDFNALSAEDFDQLIATGQRFSAAVCQTLDNYIPTDFEL